MTASLWGKQAEGLAPHLKRGQALVVQLKDVHLREYQNKDGQTVVSLEGDVIDIAFAGGKPQEDSGEQRQERAPAAPPPAKRGGFDDMDDDIPF